MSRPTRSGVKITVDRPKVRDAIRLVERNGWRLVRTRGSHRQFRHAENPGTVTIPGHPGDDLKPKTWASILRQVGIPGDKPMKLKYVVVFERTPNNYCAYLPDLPGCISTGGTWEEMQQNIREAVAAHVDMMLEYGDPLPEKPMSLEEAMTFHNASVADDVMESYSQHGEDVPALSTTFETLDFEIDPSPASRAS